MSAWSDWKTGAISDDEYEWIAGYEVRRDEAAYYDMMDRAFCNEEGDEVYDEVEEAE